MNLSDRKELYDRICTKYNKEMYIHTGDCGKENRPFSYISCKEIVMPKSSSSRPSEWNIMCLLHEIGHVATNEEEMPTYIKEYLATQWSADAAKEFGFPINDIWKDCFQKYILDFLKNETGCAYDSEIAKNLMIRW